MKRLFSLGLAAGLALSFPVYAEQAEEGTGTGLTKDIVILYTSDVHCGVENGFGYEGLYEIRRNLEEQGKYTLLVDNGDSIQGEPLGTLSTGEASIMLMNAAGYDFAIPGNHEFDYGMDRFLELTEMAEFSYISCNFNKEGELVFEPYIIKEYDDDVKIAFVGITTPKTLTASTPRYFQDENGNFVYGFFQDETGEKLYEAVQTAVDDAREEGADYVIALAHLGNEDECRPWTYADVISHTSGIDAILDGHSHDTDQVVMEDKDGNQVIRSAVGTKMGCIGALTISADSGELSTEVYTWNMDVAAPDLFGFSNPVTEALAESADEVNELMATVVASSKVDLTINDPKAVDENGKPIRIVRRAETNLGDLCADAYRDQSGADIAFVNGGGVRVDIKAGDITLNDILKVHPFGNAMCVIEVTGQQILDALEWGAHSVPGEFGGFLQVSGLTYEIHTYIDSSCVQDENTMFAGVTGEYRVKNVKVGGEPLDLAKTYTLASHDYMLLNGGDGYNMFEGAPLLQEKVKLDNQVLMDYIIDTLGGVIGDEYADPYGEGRIIAVDEAPAQQESTTAKQTEEQTTEKATEKTTEKASETEEQTSEKAAETEAQTTEAETTEAQTAEAVTETPAADTEAQGTEEPAADTEAEGTEEPAADTEAEETETETETPAA